MKGDRWAAIYQDVEPAPPTLDELKRSHDWREEHRDMHEEGDGALYVLVCEQCGHERLGSRWGAVPDCPVREVPSIAIEQARRRGLIPEEGEPAERQVSDRVQPFTGTIDMDPKSQGMSSDQFWDWSNPEEDHEIY